MIDGGDAVTRRVSVTAARKGQSTTHFRDAHDDRLRSVFERSTVDAGQFPDPRFSTDDPEHGPRRRILVVHVEFEVQ